MDTGVSESRYPPNRKARRDSRPRETAWRGTTMSGRWRSLLVTIWILGRHKYLCVFRNSSRSEAHESAAGSDRPLIAECLGHHLLSAPESGPNPARTAGRVSIARSGPICSSTSRERHFAMTETQPILPFRPGSHIVEHFVCRKFAGV